MDVQIIFGPPGTGKTTELSRLTRQYVEDEGSKSVLLCAYTKTAAHELAGRGLPLEEHQIGTLHSHCYHALDGPKIAETFHKEWNDAHPLYPMHTQKSSTFTMAEEEGPTSATSATSATSGVGDDLLDRVNLYRHRLLPLEKWSDRTKAFWRAWSAWKHDRGYLDFTDLIDQARALVPIAPGRPQTIIVDEAQDLSLLQWDLLARWGKHATRVIGAGDDDQCLYRWAGADFRPLLVAPDRRVLPKSYRVPRRIQAWASSYTNAIRQRQAKTWEPRAAEGTLHRHAWRWDVPQPMLDQLRAWWYEDPWQTFACITPCGFMLKDILETLRSEGLPFSNRWRTSRHDWNPLGPPSNGVGALQRLLDYLKPTDRLWTWQELSTWLPLIRADGVLKRGAKVQVKLHKEETRLCPLAALETLFQPEALAGALSGDLRWLKYNLLQSRADTIAYPIRVYERYGRKALTDEPRITVGTAHSVKGAEMDTVLFWNDLSRAQQVALCEGGNDADDVRRMLYVGCTRARENLVLIGHQYV